MKDLKIQSLVSTFSCRAALMHMFFFICLSKLSMKSSSTPKSFTFSSQGISTPARVKCFTCSNDLTPTATAWNYQDLPAFGWYQTSRSRWGHLFQSYFFQDVDFPAPVRDWVIICIVVDLAVSDKIENIIHKNVKYQRPQDRALCDSLDYFCPWANHHPNFNSLGSIGKIASHKPAATVRYPIRFKFFFMIRSWVWQSKAFERSIRWAPTNMFYQGPLSSPLQCEARLFDSHTRFKTLIDSYEKCHWSEVSADCQEAFHKFLRVWRVCLQDGNS